MVKSESGTYALILRSDCSTRIAVGRRGLLHVQRGYYIYTGSAFGPGGVKARVFRHCRAAHAKHWHIDYLLEVTRTLGAWCAYGSRDLEHHWAQALAAIAGVSPVPGFGSSDCACETHLFRLRSEPDFAAFSRKFPGEAEFWRFRSGDI